MPPYRHISVAVPLLAERENLPLLLSRLRAQTFRNFTLYLCVNNEEQGFGFDENQECLHLLQQVTDLPLVVIDRSSPGQGWTGKKKGVGWARKLLFERIMADHDDRELVVSLDADTDFDPDYLAAVLLTMNAHPASSAFAVPYYHPLSGTDALDRPLLRYECYMRHYLINLLLISSPYAFTALGSAIVFPLWAYRRVGGITPLQGGEDFYLLQKFAKTGTIERCFAAPVHSRLTVRPQGRPSQRVPFGTGPAVAAGLDIMATRYPFYAPAGFAAVKATYDAFPALYDHDIETPMSAFLRQQLATDDLWQPLRRNFHTLQHFIHACTERVDGLRILQYLKANPAFRLPDEAQPVHFHTDPIPVLDAFRNRLFDQEMSLRQKCASASPA
ncbi:MAG: hypothetical protein IJ785_03095 [Bacteroidales bacterium]|nr:hypothetical protein [Bacteroidales bacterium]